jgi:hypothetical protein
MKMGLGPGPIPYLKGRGARKGGHICGLSSR